jgi:hypothetical protein
MKDDLEKFLPPGETKMNLTGSSRSLYGDGLPLEECVTDQSLTNAAGEIRYTSEMKTTDTTTSAPKKEKGALVYKLSDGTLFTGTMQLKYYRW